MSSFRGRILFVILIAALVIVGFRVLSRMLSLEGDVGDPRFEHKWGTQLSQGEFEKAEQWDLRMPNLLELVSYKLENVPVPGPDQIFYRGESTLHPPGGRHHVLCLAPEGSMVLGGDSAVVRLASDGSVESRWATPEPVRALACSQSGPLYVALDRVVQRIADGSVQSDWLTGPAKGQEFVAITSLATGGDALYVGDAGARSVYRFDSAGQFAGELVSGLSISSPGLDVAVAADGVVAVSDCGKNQVVLFSATGERLASFGSHGIGFEQFCGSCNPVALAFTPEGNVLTAERGIHRVKEYGRDGLFLGFVASSDWFDYSSSVLDLAADPSGRVYLLLPWKGEVRTFGRKQDA